MYKKVFWLDTLERMVSTGAQASLLAIAGQAAEKVIDSKIVILYAFAGGAVLALLKALAALSFGSNNSASFTVDAKMYSPTDGEANR